MEADLELTYKDAKDPTNPKKNHSSKIHHKKSKVRNGPAFLLHISIEDHCPLSILSSEC
jgi:hypothetical protein